MRLCVYRTRSAGLNGSSILSSSAVTTPCKKSCERSICRISCKTACSICTKTSTWPRARGPARDTLTSPTSRKRAIRRSSSWARSSRNPGGARFVPSAKIFGNPSNLITKSAWTGSTELSDMAETRWAPVRAPDTRKPQHVEFRKRVSLPGRLWTGPYMTIAGAGLEMWEWTAEESWFP